MNFIYSDSSAIQDSIFFKISFHLFHQFTKYSDIIKKTFKEHTSFKHMSCTKYIRMSLIAIFKCHKLLF